MHKHVAAKLGSFSFEFEYKSGGSPPQSSVPRKTVGAGGDRRGISIITSRSPPDETKTRLRRPNKATPTAPTADTGDGRRNFPGRQPSSSSRSRGSKSQSREAESDDDCDREVDEESRSQSFRSTPKFVRTSSRRSSRMQRSSPSSSRQPGYSFRRAFDELDDIVFGCNPIRGCTDDDDPGAIKGCSSDDRNTDDTAAVMVHDKMKDAARCSRDSSGSFDDDSMISDNSSYRTGDDERSDNTNLRDIEDDEETLNTLEDEDKKVLVINSSVTKLQGSSNPADTVPGPTVNTMMSPNSEQQMQMPTRSFFENETPRIGSRSSSIRNKENKTYSFAASPGTHGSKDEPPRTRTTDSSGSAGTKSTFSGFNVDDASSASPSIVHVTESKEPESFAEKSSIIETEDKSTKTGAEATADTVTSALASSMVADTEASTAPVCAGEAKEGSIEIETDDYGSHEIPQAGTRSSDIIDNDDSSNVTDKITNRAAAVEKKRMAAKNDAELSGLDLIIEEVDYEMLSSKNSNDSHNQLDDQDKGNEQSSYVDNLLLEKGRSDDPHEDYEVAYEDSKHSASKANNASKRLCCNWRVWLVTGVVLIVLVSLVAGLSSKRRNNAVKSATVSDGKAPFSAALSPFTMQMELADGSTLDEEVLEDITQTHISVPMKASIDNFDELQVDVTVEKKRRLVGIKTNGEAIEASFEGTVFLLNDSFLPTQEEMNAIVVDSFAGNNFDTYVSSMAEGGMELTSLTFVHDSSATLGSSLDHVSTVRTNPQVLASLTAAPVSDSPTHSPDTNEPSSRPTTAPVGSSLDHVSTVRTNPQVLASLTTAPVSDSPTHSPDTNEPSSRPTTAPVGSSLDHVSTVRTNPQVLASLTAAPVSDSPTHSPDTNEPSSRPTTVRTNPQVLASLTSAPVTDSLTHSPDTNEPSSRPTTAPVGSSLDHVSTVRTNPQVLASLTSAPVSDSPTHSPDTNEPSSRQTTAPVGSPLDHVSTVPTNSQVLASLTTAPVSDSPTHSPDTNSPTHSPDTNEPSSRPTTAPVSSAPVTNAPASAGPTAFPVSASPTTSSPTFSPSSTPVTATPSFLPTSNPSLKPTNTPTVPPSLNPTNPPTPLPIWENSAPGLLVTNFHAQMSTDGIMFDVSAKESDVEITSIEIHLDSNEADIPVDIISIQGSYMGWELYSRIWRSSNKYNIPNGFGYGKRTPISDNFKPIKVPAGKRVGIYVTLLEGHKMLVGSGYETTGDAFVKINSGASVPNRFASLERGVSWSGAIRYTTN